MQNISIGILGTADIAYRRFLPALHKSKFYFSAIASRNIVKTKKFTDRFGGRGYGSYQELLDDKSIDAVYIPLPPAMHFEWAKRALDSGKHVFLEKPFTTDIADTQELLALADQKDLALHENYMFQYHSQLSYIRTIQETKQLGEIRLIRIAFGFPMRNSDDFRYNKSLGGGALLDCGGYTLKLASILLGKYTGVKEAALSSVPGFDVDIYGCVTLSNDSGVRAQVAFGMDQIYRCELEIWGSQGYLKAPRIFTAPDNFEPKLILESLSERKTISLPTDDQFLNSIQVFQQCVKKKEMRMQQYEEIQLQSQLLHQVINWRKMK